MISGHHLPLSWPLARPRHCIVVYAITISVIIASLRNQLAAVPIGTVSVRYAAIAGAPVVDGGDLPPADAPQRRDRAVPFIPDSQITPGESYSGMWWQPIDAAVAIDYGSVSMLEGISFRAFNLHSGDSKTRVLQTADWPDFAVEHTSKYVKHFRRRGAHVGDDDRRADDGMTSGVMLILERYIRDGRHVRGALDERPGLAPRKTIAVLPIIATAPPPPPSSSSSESSFSEDDRLLILQTAATLASLWRIGIARAVVSGPSEREGAIAEEAFTMLRDKVAARPMELGYVRIDGLTDKDRKLVPRVAMARFRSAIEESRSMDGVTTPLKNESQARIGSDRVRSWLGTNHSRWRFVYFTEPDLILHVRPEALPALSEALNGGNLLTAHRLQPLPHARDFAKFLNNATGAEVNSARRRILPNWGPFKNVEELDWRKPDVCCDLGNFYPANAKDPGKPEKILISGACRTSVWSFCGFDRSGWDDYGNRSAVLKQHERLLRYPLISLEGGTGLTLVHHSQRSCALKRGNATCSVA